MTVRVFVFIYLFWLNPTTCRILVPRPGMETLPAAVGAQSPNNWTIRDVPSPACFLKRSPQAKFKRMLGMKIKVRSTDAFK